VGFKVKEKPRIVNSVLSHLVVEKTYNPLNTKFGFFFFFSPDFLIDMGDRN
jgi:hypothetical protein